MTGIFREAIDHVLTELDTANIPATTDPRAARPGVVFLEMPTFDGFSNNIADITVVLRFLAPGPGNQVSSDAALKMADDLIQVFAGAITTGRPTAAIIGDQTLPAYDFTLRLAVKRDPEPPEE